MKKTTKISITLLFLITTSFAELTSSPLQEKPLTPADSAKIDTIASAKKSGGFSFKADDVDLHTALALFAHSGGFTLRADTILNQQVSVSFENLDLNQAMMRILGNQDLPWKVENGQLIVGTPTEANSIKQKIGNLEVEGNHLYRIFTINYPRINRKREVSTEGSVDGLEGKAAQISITSESDVKFWQEIEEALKALLDESDQYSMNYQAGVLFVKASTFKLDVLQKYFEKVVPILTRQVLVTARIYEVSLNDDQALGVDWTRIDASLSAFGTSGTFGISTTNEQTGASFKTSTISAVGSKGSTGRIQAMVNALSEQGNVTSVSQPRIITLNNQAAVVKVGTLYPYFTTGITIDPQTGQRDILETSELISIGTWLSVTPQISSDSVITLIVDPVITDLAGTITSRQGSTAPIVDIKQSSSIVRLKNLETIRISGLQQTKKSELRRGIPWISEIPYLGALFRWSYTSESRKELVVFITPQLLD